MFLELGKFLDLRYGKQQIKDDSEFSNFRDWMYGNRGGRGARISGLTAELGVRLAELEML